MILSSSFDFLFVHILNDLVFIVVVKILTQAKNYERQTDGKCSNVNVDNAQDSVMKMFGL